jgi:hypothetical protein
MYAHPYLLRLIAEEHNRNMRSTAAAARLSRQARRARRARPAASHAAVPDSRLDLLHTIPQPGELREEMARRAA